MSPDPERSLPVVGCAFDAIDDCRRCHFLVREIIIAKSQHTYAKRKREMDKKQKAEAKRQRREERRRGTPPQSGFPIRLTEKARLPDAF